MSDLETLNAYEARISEYEAVAAISPSQMRALEAFTAQLEAGAKVLDLGCGPGFHANWMIQRGFEVEAWDATLGFVDAALSRGVKARLARFEDLTAQGDYDGIWASFSLLHAAPDAFLRHLDAIQAALKPRGIFFIGMKTGAGVERDSLGRYYSYYSVEDLMQALETCGFSLLWQETGEEPGLAGTVAPFVLMLAKRG